MRVDFERKNIVYFRGKIYVLFGSLVDLVGGDFVI